MKLKKKVEIIIICVVFLFLVPFITSLVLETGTKVQPNSSSAGYYTINNTAHMAEFGVNSTDAKFIGLYSGNQTVCVYFPNHTLISCPCVDASDCVIPQTSVNKYLTFGDAPSVVSTLISPANDSTQISNITFNCSAVATKSSLVNISLYGNWSGGWNLNQTNSVTGTSNSTTFNVTGLIKGSYKWNCLASNDQGNTDFADANWTFTVNNTPPTHTTPILNSTYGTNLTTENLTCYNQSTADLDGDSVKNIFNWYRNGTSIMVLNMPFEGGSNSTYTKDYSGFGNNGFPTLFGENGNWTTGKVGNAFRFDGVDDIINASFTQSLNMSGSNQMTVSFWIYPTGGATTDQEIIARTTAVPNANYRLAHFVVGLNVLGDNLITFGHGNTTGYRAASASISNNAWTFITGVLNSTHIAIYKNGVYVTSSTRQSGMVNINTPLRISATYNGLIGTLDEIRLWNRSLSSTEIFNIYSNESIGQYDANMNTTGLVGEWHLNESSGVVAEDTSGSGNNGTKYGDFNYSSSFNSTGGYDGSSAYTFNGKCDQIHLPSTVSLRVSNLTLSAWIYGNTFSHNAQPVILSRGYYNYEFMVWSTGQLRAYFGNATSFNLYDSGYIIPTKTWNHVAVTANGTNVTFYVNGTQVKTLPLKGAVRQQAAVLAIGKREDGYNYPFNGTIDEVRIYNYSLSAAQILALYQNKTNTIVANETTKGENWICSVTPNDGEADGSTLNSSGLTILNSAPTTPTTLALTNPLYVGDTLTADGSGSSDADGDSIAYYYEFYNVNDSSLLQSYSIDHTVLIQQSDARDIIRVRTKAYDGTVYSGEKEANRTVSNTPPTHTTPILNSTYGTNLTIENLTCYNQSTADEDGDSVKNIFNWYRNGTSIMVLNMPFEGGSNSTWAKDYSTNSNHGTVSGATFNSTEGYDSKGVYEFDGVEDYITVPLNYTNGFNKNEGTVCLWTKYSGGSVASAFNSSRLIQMTDDSTDSMRLEYNYNNGTLRFFYFNGTVFQSATTISLNNTWAHVCGWWNSTHLQLYTNGIATGDLQAYTVKNFNVEPVIYIGNDNTVFGYTVNGTIDEVRIYNYSLSAAQILALYQNKTNTIVANETTKGENWICSVTPNDGEADGSTLNSSGLTILNTVPSVTLISPADGASVTNRTPLLSWTGYDADGDSLTYELNLTLIPSSLCTDPNLNQSGLSDSNYTPGDYLKCLYDNGDYYAWSVRASDDDGVTYGEWSETRIFNVTAEVIISLPVNVIEFGTMNFDETKNTTTDSPPPFELQNDGNCFVNISVNATQLFTSKSDASDNYKYKIDNKTGEEGSFSWAVISWQQMSITSSETAIADFNWDNLIDTAEIDLLVTVPFEAPGTKSTTVYLTASLSE